LIETSYSLMLRNLSNDYYQNRIEFEDYRNRRKIILDKIDLEFNGDKPRIEVIVNQDQKSEFMQTIAFYKNSDVEK
jgi:hypothetical protein